MICVILIGDRVNIKDGPYARRSGCVAERSGGGVLMIELDGAPVIDPMPSGRGRKTNRVYVMQTDCLPERLL